MAGTIYRCALIAEGHAGIAERIRSLLATSFTAVVTVIDEASLLEGVSRLQPEIAVVDLSLPLGGDLRWIRRLHELCRETRVILLSAYDQPGVRQAALEAGADDFLLTRSLTPDLPTAVQTLMTQ